LLNQINYALKKKIPQTLKPVGQRKMLDFRGIILQNLLEKSGEKGRMTVSAYFKRKIWRIRSSPTHIRSLELWREKQKVRQWQLRIRQPVQTVLRETFWKNKFRVNADCLRNMRKRLIT
jgi:hypothetical protein